MRTATEVKEIVLGEITEMIQGHLATNDELEMSEDKRQESTYNFLEELTAEIEEWHARLPFLLREIDPDRDLGIRKRPPTVNVADNCDALDYRLFEFDLGEI